jgi:hypothetical protein
MEVVWMLTWNGHREHIRNMTMNHDPNKYVSVCGKQLDTSHTKAVAKKPHLRIPQCKICLAWKKRWQL